MRTWLSAKSRTPNHENSPPSQAFNVTPPEVVHLQPKPTMSNNAAVLSQPMLEEHPAVFPALPFLHYSMYGRRLSLTVFVIGTIIDSLVFPVGLYFILWYGFGPGNRKWHPLSASTTLTIVTATIGGTSLWQLIRRGWRLARKDSIYRPAGASRWHLDWFEWWFLLTWILIIVELSVAFVPNNPDRRMLALPMPTVLAVFGTASLLLDILWCFSVRAPIRISSISKGAELRPGIYPIIEDVCAVDGSGKTEFRTNLDRRYCASHVFRVMLRRLGLFWGIGAECCAALTFSLVFGLDDDLVDWAYTIGWAAPFVWAGPWILATYLYVRRELKKEKKLWMDSHGGSESRLAVSTL
ncbi:hypothetical protein DM02DRAFT_616202 [Periconia macrospinosa]|uniref:Uncharacterized protein n=1 Tax=Periconia macrospinosa TaxID=97972 RepID=A0A2V1DHZ9_9PLEO|nr:hypothetical protein DM02DRAFT_616202 [Periconia macrospinosa]